MMRWVRGLLAQAWSVLLDPKTIGVMLLVGVVLVSAVAVNYTTYQTRVLYQTQQTQFADLQSLQNERSQLSLEVGALASHARLESWAKSAGFEVISEHEVLP